MKIEVTIEGITPLLLNRFTEEAQQSAESGSRLSLNGDKGSPREQAAKKLYYGADEKTLMVPGPNLFSCLIEAGKFHKSGRSKLTTTKSSLIPAALMILESELPISSVEGWRVDTRAVRNPATQGRRPCHRPMFDDWQLSFTLDLDQDFIGSKLCRMLVDDAGKRIGLGDFRPSCKGPFGRFVVTSWKEFEKE